MVYWHNEDYVGIGPGAHSHLHTADGAGTMISQRWANRRPVPGYVKRMAQGESVVDFSETLPPAVSMGETMMLGLRLIDEGVTFARFRQRHRVDMRDVYDDTLAQLRQEGLLTMDAEGVRLTRHGLMLGNQVFMRFLAEPAAA
ncbi:MAG: hypothetical protein R3A10_10420 [Caldilineaceae bacterium]